MCVSRTGSIGNQYKSDYNDFFVPVVRVDTGEEIFKISIGESEQLRNKSTILDFEYIGKEGNDILVKPGKSAKDLLLNNQKANG